MMTKKEILQHVHELAAIGHVTKDELMTAYHEGIETDGGTPHEKIGMAEILYYIGGFIIFLGICILVWQNWNTLNAITKILATFGSGIAAYFVGFLFTRSEKTEKVGMVFYFISALVTPVGLFVIFDNAGYDETSFGSQMLISGMMFAMQIMSYFAFRKNIFILFSIIFGTWLFFSVTSFLVRGNPYFTDLDFYEYRILFTGLAYMLLGYFFSQNKEESLSDALYGFGILGFLGAALSLGGYKPEQNMFWELIFPGLVFGALFLSVYLKKRSLLIFGTIFLMVFILKITAEYFKTGLGWPLSLVIAGLMLIAVGYLSFYLKKKYISS